MGDSLNQPIGIRQNNPGNIRVGESWLGSLPPRKGDAFCRFEAPVWGLRAMACLLRNYYRRHGLRTIRQVVARWAPSNENNVEAYVRSVAEHSGLPADTAMDFSSADVLRRIIPAMVRHENGRNPYTPELIDQAIVLSVNPVPAHRVQHLGSTS